MSYPSTKAPAASAFDAVAPPNAPSTAVAPTARTPRRSIADLADIPHETWQTARCRQEVIGPLSAMAHRRRSDVREAAQKLGCSVAWLYVLLKRFEQDTRLTAFLPAPPGPSPGRRLLTPSQEQIIEAAVEEFYLTRQQPKVSALMMDIQQRCTKLGLRAPSRQAVQRRIDARQPAEVLRRRRGRKAARDRFGAVSGSFHAAKPLSVVQIDHTVVDVMVVDSLTRRPLRRPWLTLAIDVHTRCVLGFYLALEPPSATSVALCVAHSVLPKTPWMTARGVDGEWPCEGMMRCLHLDNGREFHSEALRRGCEQYGIALDYRPVRTPHYGGHIERLIGTMMGQVHLLPGTTFSNIAAKGDLNPDLSATLTLDELERWLATAVVGVYHQRLHRGIGKTPAVAWREAINPSLERADDAVVLPYDPRRFFIDFLPIERRRVRREGIVLRQIHYWSDVLHTWIGDSQRMIVRYDPRDLSRIYLRGPDGVYYDVPYRDLARPRISWWEHAAAVQRLRAEGRKSVDESAIFAAIETMRRIADEASADTKRLRRQRERARRLDATKSLANAAPLPKPEEALNLQPSFQERFTDVEDWL